MLGYLCRLWSVGSDWKVVVDGPYGTRSIKRILLPRHVSDKINGHRTLNDGLPSNGDGCNSVQLPVEKVKAREQTYPRLLWSEWGNERRSRMFI